jgi:small-conductance mechanosensitive channel
MLARRGNFRESNLRAMSPDPHAFMSVRLRRLLPIAALALAGCGLFGGDEAPREPESPPAPAAAPETGPAEADTRDDALNPGGDATSPPAALPEEDPAPDGGAEMPDDQEPERQQPLTLDERLDLILANQIAIERRLDSLAARAVPDSARSVAGGQVLGEAGRSVQNFGVGVVWSILVLMLFNFVIRGMAWVLDTLAERNTARRLFYKRLVPVVRIVLWIFAAYLIVRVIFQVDAQGIFAAAAAIGVAVGFASQDLLKNLFGGLILVFDQPFQVGDKVSVGGTYGEVVSIGLRSTRIVTADDNLVSVPNAQVVDQQVANANAGQLNCMVVTDLYLPGWADEEAARRIAFDAAASSKYVYLNKPIVVLVSDVFKETFLTRVRVKAYVLDPRLEFLFQSDVTERARAGFREAGLLKPEHHRTWLVERSAVGIGPVATPTGASENGEPEEGTPEQAAAVQPPPTEEARERA